MMSRSLLVTLCTYNERENLEQLIPEIFEHVPEASILVVDDNSPDGTGEYVDELARDNPRIYAIHRSGKLGLGTATVAAFNYGIEHKFDLLLNLDADFSHPPRFMSSMIEKAEEYDVVIGSRYVPGGEIVGWGPKRHMMSRGINFYAKAMLGLKTLDNSGSFRCYRVPKLAEVDWSQSKAKGYAFQEEILYRLRRVGATFAEVPITFEERRFGVTKINMKEAVSAAWVLMSLRFRS
ncbi:polyprenol monophosphomannose synthase [Thalassoglobus sp. JC818]|uniref:polyprenol monophosphomannose synthase n=1 Tax=Thalassoglobus sp. JC818 TaxID=3232136 RepID=UPI0034594011